jgi:hypothetical protein
MAICDDSQCLPNAASAVERVDSTLAGSGDGLPPTLRFSLRRLMAIVAVLAAVCVYAPPAIDEWTSTYEGYDLARMIAPPVAAAFGYWAGRLTFRAAASLWLHRAMRLATLAAAVPLAALTAYVVWGDVRIYGIDPTGNEWGRDYPYPDAMLIRWADWMNPELSDYWCLNCIIAEVLYHVDRACLALITLSSATAAVLTPRLPYQLPRAIGRLIVRTIRWYMRW